MSVHDAVPEPPDDEMRDYAQLLEAYDRHDAECDRLTFEVRIDIRDTLREISGTLSQIVAWIRSEKTDDGE